MAKSILLADGTIDEREVEVLRKEFFADGKVDFGEKRFLQELRAGAKQVSKEFEALYNQCMAS
jgi:hypothetical protein